MKILITNDDGVTSNGILAARDAVKDFGETVIVAPLHQQSGVGHAISLMKTLRANPVMLSDGTDAYAVTGTPTDCVILGTKAILDEEPDLVISGINIGENLATTITTSGTLGAAFEAAVFNIPAIAVSLQVNHEELKFTDGENTIDYSHCISILKKLVKKVIEHGMPEGVNFLNLNIPAHPVSDEIIQSSLAHRMYTTDVEKRIDPFGKPYYWIIGDLINDCEDGSDVNTLRILNQPSITAISTDMGVDVDLSRWLDD